MRRSAEVDGSIPSWGQNLFRGRLTVGRDAVNVAMRVRFLPSEPSTKDMGLIPILREQVA